MPAKLRDLGAITLRHGTPAVTTAEFQKFNLNVQGNLSTGLLIPGLRTELKKLNEW